MMFVKGDRVVIARKIPSHYNGWKDTWTEDMSKLVGQVGEVVEIHSYGFRVRVDRDRSTFNYPPEALDFEHPDGEE